MQSKARNVVIPFDVSTSWGEANPGGGKDRVEYFVERARQNVVDARDSLGTVIRILKLET